MGQEISFADAVRSGLDPKDLVIRLPNLAVLIMGASGAGKTHFMGTTPKPLLVQQFDAPDKAATYENLGFLPGPLEAGKFCDFQRFYSAKEPERWVIQVEFFNEPDPRNAKSMSNFMARMNDIERDIKEWGVKTVGLDSLTFFELAARMYSKFTHHPTNKRGEDVADERIHYRASAQMVEEFILARYPGLQRLANCVIISHVQNATIEDAGEDENRREQRKVIAAPGKLPAKIPAALSEVYRLYIDERGQRCLQTGPRNENIFECKSTRGIADPTQAHWRAITKQLEERYAKRLIELTLKEDGSK